MCISVTYSHQLEDPSKKENHSYSFGQLNDPVYNDISFTVGSLDMDPGLACTVSDQVTKGYVCIEHLTKRQTELTNSTVNNESIDNDFYDVDQHTYEMVKANMKKNDNEEGDQNKSKFNVQENSHYSTLGIDKICFFFYLFCFSFLLNIFTHFAFQPTHFAFQPTRSACLSPILGSSVKST